MNQYLLARNLAMASIGLGLAEVLAPRKVARLIGVSEDHERILQAMGLREIASGLGIMQGRAAHFLWGRVAGDAVDLALLAAARRSPRSNPQRIAGAMVAVAGITALDVIASLLHSRSYAQPEWRDPRPMEERGAIAHPGWQALRSSADASAPFEPVPESTASEDLTEAGPGNSSAGRRA